MTCEVCGAALTARQVEAVATVGPLTVELAPVEVAACPEGHTVVRLSVADVVDGVRGQVTVARRRRLARSDRCGQCQADLVMPARGTQTPVPIVVDGQVVTVLLECPMVRCPDCGREQVPSEVDRVLDRAVASALDRVVDE